MDERYRGARRVLEIWLRGLAITIDSLADEVHPPRPKRVRVSPPKPATNRPVWFDNH
jgi:hypothetical protein